MVIYKHTLDYDNKIKTTPLEAEEKPKTYILVNDRGWKTRILKTDIDKTLGRYDKYMYTLTPDNTPFIKEIIEITERNIESLKNRLENAVAKKTTLLKLLEKQ